MKKPETAEITEYLIKEKNYSDFEAMGFADKFWNYYESVGWTVGKNKPMKNWKAAIRTWEINIKNNGSNKQTPNGNSQKLGTSAARIEALRKW